MHYFNIHFIVCVMQGTKKRREKNFPNVIKMCHRQFCSVSYLVVVPLLSFLFKYMNDFTEFVVFPKRFLHACHRHFLMLQSKCNKITLIDLAYNEKQGKTFGAAGDLMLQLCDWKFDVI